MTAMTEFGADSLRIPASWDHLKIPTNWKILSEWLPTGSYRMTPTKMLLAGAAMTALLATFAIQRLPGEERIEVPKPTMVERFEPMTVTPKSDPIRQIDLAKFAEPKPIVTERINAPDAPASMPPVVVVQEAPQPSVPRRGRAVETKDRGSALCQRHGMRKVMVGQYKWRCRK